MRAEWEVKRYAQEFLKRNKERMRGMVYTYF